jgi:hypothetical protein
VTCATPNSNVEEEPDGQRFPCGDSYSPAGLWRTQALGRRADQVGAGLDSQFLAASVIGSSSGYDVTLVQRFDHGSGHRSGV